MAFKKYKNHISTDNFKSGDTVKTRKIIKTSNGYFERGSIVTVIHVNKVNDTLDISDEFNNMAFGIFPDDIKNLKINHADIDH